MHVSTVILVSFVTSLLTAVGTAYVVERYDMVPKQAVAVVETAVPDLKGMAEADARLAAAAAQLTLVVAGHEANGEAKPETVLKQSLVAAQKVPLHQIVSVTLAEAIPKVPAVIGVSVEEATKRLQEAGYTIQVAGSLPDAKVPEGEVARQMPNADSTYVKGAAVTVQLSAGPGAVDLPQFTGKPFKKAMDEIESLGLKAAVGWISRGETPAYVILNQSPAAGTKLDPGSVVRFTVNR